MKLCVTRDYSLNASAPLTCGLALSQFFPNIHQDLAKAIFATPIGTAAPIIIFGRVLHDLYIPGFQQNFSDLSIGFKLCEHCLSHHLVLDLFPIAAQRTLTAAPHPCGDCWRCCLADLLNVLGSHKFLSLKIMFT